MAKQVRMRRTRSGMVFVEKTSAAHQAVSATYMKVSLTTLVLSLLLIVAGLSIAILKVGDAPAWVGAFPAGSLVLSGLGAYISWYAHKHTREESKTPWTYGFLPNAAVVIILLIVYFSGIFM